MSCVGPGRGSEKAVAGSVRGPSVDCTNTCGSQRVSGSRGRGGRTVGPSRDRPGRVCYRTGPAGGYSTASDSTAAEGGTGHSSPAHPSFPLSGAGGRVLPTQSRVETVRESDRGRGDPGLEGRDGTVDVSDTSVGGPPSPMSTATGPARATGGRRGRRPARTTQARDLASRGTGAGSPLRRSSGLGHPATPPPTYHSQRRESW